MLIFFHDSLVVFHVFFGFMCFNNIYRSDLSAAIRPKTIVFDHFDDAFPPLTKRMDVEGYCALLRKMYPNMGLVIPREQSALTV